MVLGLLVHVTASIFFRRILRSEALLYKSYFFRAAVLRTLFEFRFSYDHCNFLRVCLLVKMASKTVTRSIVKLVLLSVRGLYDKNSASYYCFTSDVMYKWYERLVYTHPDLLARFCKVNMSNTKFSRPN